MLAPTVEPVTFCDSRLKAVVEGGTLLSAAVEGVDNWPLLLNKPAGIVVEYAPAVVYIAVELALLGSIAGLRTLVAVVESV